VCFVIGIVMLTYLDTLIGFSVVMLGVSLVITILNQAVAALFAHRGADLLWGLETLFKNIDPGGSAARQYPTLFEFARQVAQAVLTHPLASDSIFSSPQPSQAKFLIGRWRLANAITPSELAAVLARLSKDPPAAVPVAKHPSLTIEINALLGLPNPMATREVKLLTDFTAAVPGAQPSLPTLALRSDRATPGDLEAWFGTIADRVRQRFTTRMRVWTVGFAFALAFLMGLDTFTLLSNLYTNENLRSQLAGSADQILKTARDVQGGQLYSGALNKAVADAKITLPPATGIKNYDEALAWITTNIVENRREDVVRALDVEFTSIESQRLSSISGVLSKAGLLPLSLTNWPSTVRQYLGVLVSVLLLCLGAPFWFNTLSSLTSLRPLLAGKQSSAGGSKPSQ
jgi:hypothetical protein